MLLIICPDPSQKDLFDLIVAVIELIPRADQSLGDFKLSMKNKRQIFTWSTESRYTPEVQQLAPEKLVVGRRSFPFGARWLFRGRTVKLRGGSWGIIPSSKWLISMVSKSPNCGSSPCKWLLTRMILQVSFRVSFLARAKSRFQNSPAPLFTFYMYRAVSDEVYPPMTLGDDEVVSLQCC